VNSIEHCWEPRSLRSREFAREISKIRGFSLYGAAVTKGVASNGIFKGYVPLVQGLDRYSIKQKMNNTTILLFWQAYNVGRAGDQVTFFPAERSMRGAHNLHLPLQLPNRDGLTMTGYLN